MNLKIRYLKKAKVFLKKNSHLLSEEKVDSLLILAAKKIFLKEDNIVDLKQLKEKIQAETDKYIGLKDQIALENQKNNGYGDYLAKLFA